ncbi:kinase-like protein [Phaeosphaeriaceae sp. SRC1lsM3a]|nr:kinase-like protein [Stagonospora sp. SRC1lsM3a]
MDETHGDPLPSLSQNRQPKLRASCNVCAEAKVKCSKERPICARCMSNGSACIYGYSMKKFSVTKKKNLDTPSSVMVGNSGEHPPRSDKEQRPKLRAYCDTCAGLKLKCSKEHPICARCLHHGLRCVYSISRKSTTNETPLIESSPLVPSDADRRALGYHTFIWRYPAKEVFVTGSFDGWSKSVQLDRRGDIFEKGVSLPKTRTTYKFVVDGVWVLDPMAPTEEYGRGVYDNVLLPEEIVDDRWAEIKRNAAQRAVRGQSKDQESGDESIEERVARIKARVVELTTSEGKQASGIGLHHGSQEWESIALNDISVHPNSLSHSITYSSRSNDNDETSNQDKGTNEIVDEMELDDPPANPKLHRIFSVMDDEPTRKAFDAHDISDLWLPIPKQAVKRLLADDRKTKAFLRAQDDALDSKFHLLGNTSPLSRYGSGHTSIDDDEGHIQELRILGEGACGVVEEVIVNPSSTMVRCVRKRIGRPRQLKALKQIMAIFAREVGVMRQVDHHHCVRFVGSYTDMDHINILSTPVADIDLAAFLDVPIHDRERRILYRGFGCLCGAINYLHKRNIRHEDLKPQNVLIHGDNILLTDFGFSLDFSDDSMSTTTGRPSAWTIRYSAPEVLDFEPRNRATDIWSLGCVLLEMVSAFNGTGLSDLKERWKHTGNGQSSFARNIDAVRKWFKDEISNPSLQETVRHLCFLIRSMLNENRTYRPTAGQIVDRLFDISSMALKDDTMRISAPCQGPTPCIGLSYSRSNGKYTFPTLRLGGIPDLVEYLHPNRYADWRWGIFDLEWNTIDSDASNTGRSVPWSQVFSENSHIIRAACDEIYHKASRSGTTKAYWSAYQKKSSSTLSQTLEGRLHARSSAMMLTARHAVFRRLLLHSSFWADASKEQSTNMRSVQFTLLPINLPKSRFSGDFFWKLSWPKQRRAVELDDEIRDLTSMEWPQ